MPTVSASAGGFGGAFTAPILGAFMVSEFAPTPKRRYVASIVPQLIAATMGFVVFYSVVSRTFLELYEPPGSWTRVATCIGCAEASAGRAIPTEVAGRRSRSGT